MSTWAILLAAGRGQRTGSALAKQFLPYRGEPLFWHSAKTFARVPGIHGLVFVFPPEVPPGSPSASPPDALSWPLFWNAASGEDLLSRLEAASPLRLPRRLAVGGDLRQDSVAAGLAVLPPDCDLVLVHDSARPFASPALILRVLEALRQGRPAVLPGIAVTDTIKSVDNQGRVLATPERSGLRAAQTPQGFALAPLRQAHARAAAEGWRVTDDAALLERLGIPVHLVPGEESNRKITTAEDLALLEEGGPERSGSAGNGVRNGTGRDLPPLLPCTGLGYDVHRYGGNRPLILGGVPVACDIRVEAHSDGDVLLHALTDALLGLSGRGDIGAHFPDSDPAFDNIPSGVLLSDVLEDARARGIILCHADLTIIAQVPRLAPHREAIAANLAKLLSLPRHAVNVKATTEEGLGFTGEKKGIKAVAVVSGLRPVRPQNAVLCESSGAVLHEVSGVVPRESSGAVPHEAPTPGAVAHEPSAAKPAPSAAKGAGS